MGGTRRCRVAALVAGIGVRSNRWPLTRRKRARPRIGNVAGTDDLTRLGALVDDLRRELRRCDDALVSYERGILNSAELRETLVSSSPMSVASVRSTRTLIQGLLHDLEDRSGASG